MIHPLDTLKGIRNSRVYPYMNKNKLYSKFSIGDYTFGQPHVLTWGEKSKLNIGKFCSIAEGVIIILGGEHNKNWITTYPFWTALKEFFDYPTNYSGTKGDVTIGNDVWIGIDSLILSGVTIGDGAVIGARAVVSKDVEPYAIVAGNPIHTIGKRFDQETINQLLTIKWWDWDIKRIKENMPLLLSNRVKEFFEKNKS